MARGSIETLRSGYRARVYAGQDPITGKQSYVRGQVWRDWEKAEKDRVQLLAQVEAGNHPNRAATVTVLMEAWAEVAEHELTTRETTASYVRRIISPALGDWQLRKLQHRVDVLDRFYKHLAAAARCARVSRTSSTSARTPTTVLPRSAGRTFASL